MKIKIGKYKYESVGTDEPIKDFYIQEDGGDGNAVIRQQIDRSEYNFDKMFDIHNKKGFYTMINHNKINGLTPLTWTNNPHILKINKENTQL